MITIAQILQERTREKKQGETEEEVNSNKYGCLGELGAWRSHSIGQMSFRSFREPR